MPGPKPLHSHAQIPLRRSQIPAPRGRALHPSPPSRSLRRSCAWPQIPFSPAPNPPCTDPSPSPRGLAPLLPPSTRKGAVYICCRRSQVHLIYVFFLFFSVSSYLALLHVVSCDATQVSTMAHNLYGIFFMHTCYLVVRNYLNLFLKYRHLHLVETCGAYLEQKRTSSKYIFSLKNILYVIIFISMILF